MREIESLLDGVYAGQERLTSEEIYRQAVAARLSGRAISALAALPEGEYAMEEVMPALTQLGADIPADEPGVPAEGLSDADLERELAQLHRTRHDTFLHGPTGALQAHTERTAALEEEYERRHPERDVSPGRLRGGAR